ncbi:hypothetical protein Csa_019334 [Cucumis sativus]|uniref:Uncharacterized protein n=1 Tax=Cucumis sativus TaxID=3659 RepID=A0A0A0LFT0_CUCSA|nr:hypothetical protein Csa_019334 [Cucumis sativus]
MNLPSWNARGLESLRAFRAVSDLIRSKNSSIMFFSTKSGEEVANQIKIMELLLTILLPSSCPSCDNTGAVNESISPKADAIMDSMLFSPNVSSEH